MSLMNVFLKYELVNSSYLRYTLPIKNFYLIKWLPQARTNIHGHDGKQCKFVILNDTLLEKRYNNNFNIETHILKSYKVHYLKIYRKTYLIY